MALASPPRLHELIHDDAVLLLFFSCPPIALEDSSFLLQPLPFYLLLPPFLLVFPACLFEPLTFLDQLTLVFLCTFSGFAARLFFRPARAFSSEELGLLISGLFNAHDIVEWN